MRLGIPLIAFSVCVLAGYAEVRLQARNSPKWIRTRRQKREPSQAGERSRYLAVPWCLRSSRPSIRSQGFGIQILEQHKGEIA